MTNELQNIMNLIYRDEPLLALLLVNKIKGEDARKIERKLEKKLAHILDYDTYLTKYANGSMDWKPMYVAYPHYFWIFNQIIEDRPMSLIDLGCYEGTIEFVSAINLGIKVRGVELNKENVKWNNARAQRIKGNIKFIQSTIEEYTDVDKYDAVICTEVIEHVPDPHAIVDKMLELVSERGYCYLTTPDGAWKGGDGKRIWNTKGALFDHIRTFGPKKVAGLIGNHPIEMFSNDSGTLFVKFKKNGKM
jgi:2-polyprenyl-3-methyl-5-hydroxy-6-metoxy-1,4-benzoquinol methylase